MISIKLLHVQAPECHPQGIYLNKGMFFLEEEINITQTCKFVFGPPLKSSAPV
jgi:hypothetical protein